MIAYRTQSNVPILYSASSALAYRAFASTFEAMEASFFCREHVLQIPGLRRRDEAPDEQEFIAEENVHFDGRGKTKENVAADDETIKTSNVPPTSDSEGDNEEPMGDNDETTRMQALTFDPSPPLEEEEEIHLAANDDQAKLMRWHYCLGHLSFAKLKLLAKNGEISRLPGQGPSTQVRRLFIWRHDEGAMAQQGI